VNLVIAPALVGRATTFASRDSGTPSTALPVGTSVGDVVVSYIESHSVASVRCAEHWTRVIDLAKRGGARLVACVVADTGDPPDPTAQVRPPGEVSMVTMAFSGTSDTHPVEGAAVRIGSTSPSVAIKTTGAMLVVGEGIDGWRTVSRVPRGTRHGASVNDSRNSQVAVATMSVPAAGDTMATAWPTISDQGSTVAGTVALRPATPGVHPQPVPTCGNASVLTGPNKAPRRALTIPAGDNSALTPNYANPGFSVPNTTFYFAPGTHTLGSGQYSQIDPGNGDTYIGAPGAIINGQGVNNGAFEGTASDVTIEYLTIENFNSPEGQMVVNHNGGVGWTVEYNTIENNLGGAGVGLGSNSLTTENCLTNNGEYGFSTLCGADCSPLTGGAQNVTLTDNEISYNDSAGAYDHPGGISCGCSGGGKFWATDGATVTGNYIHNNLGDAGLWADTDNTGFKISGNYFSDNFGPAVEYEISYNAEITDNTFKDNAWGAGAANPGFPEGAIYISESGGNSQVPGFSSGSLSITDSLFTDNWSGVVLWESADRFCSSPSQPSPNCVLTDPSLYYYNGSPTAAGGCGEVDLTGATAGSKSGTPPADYYDGCRWKTQNVTVYGNSFNLTHADVPGCNLSANSCGQNAIFSQYGSEPSWSPYKGSVVERAITAEQNNEFSDNTYSGPWSFMYFDQAGIKTFAQWRHNYGQDASSTFASS
jgi:hypothetical protein